jgi:hypothetical protein
MAYWKQYNNGDANTTTSSGINMQTMSQDGTKYIPTLGWLVLQAIIFKQRLLLAKELEQMILNKYWDY